MVSFSDSYSPLWLYNVYASECKTKYEYKSLIGRLAFIFSYGFVMDQGFRNITRPEAFRRIKHRFSYLDDFSKSLIGNAFGFDWYKVNSKMQDGDNIIINLVLKQYEEKMCRVWPEVSINYKEPKCLRIRGLLFQWVRSSVVLYSDDTIWNMIKTFQVEEVLLLQYCEDSATYSVMMYVIKHRPQSLGLIQNILDHIKSTDASKWYGYKKSKEKYTVNNSSLSIAVDQKAYDVFNLLISNMSPSEIRETKINVSEFYGL
eukprot:TRINITY_DN5241_c0_g2_i3.p1 TRINITY_DN5241_c0_g2~~TRINITY_DN5241_c0_g2_i3.p1  ORF type:complete len:259 (+),score=4.87 TRINITY_DN5241_c0_g2_i3:108-884(+)